MEDKNESVYEIGYLIASSIPEEKIPGEADAIKKIIVDSGASVISEEAPVHQQLSYTMRKKMISGVYEKYDTAYFGWIKFEVGSDKIESIKNKIEVIPSVLRMLLISTVKENTYLGKRIGTLVSKDSSGEVVEETIDEVPVSIEEMDKSIDAIVKEA